MGNKRKLIFYLLQLITLDSTVLEVRLESDGWGFDCQPFISDWDSKRCEFTHVVCILCILVSFLFSCTAFRALRSAVLQSPLAIYRKRKTCELFIDNKSILSCVCVFLKVIGLLELVEFLSSLMRNLKFSFSSRNFVGDVRNYFLQISKRKTCTTCCVTT